MNDPDLPTADAPCQPSGRFARAVQEFAAQYAAAILTALIVARCCFPGNAFMPVPWLSDDYRNLAIHLDLGPGLRIDFLQTRPVSTSLIKYLSAAGETAYFLAMFLLMALLPLLAVRLALRLYRCQLGPWPMLWLVAAVSFGTFLFEGSPWFYRYTGMMTNLISVTTGFLAAYCFCRFFDGSKSAFALACLLFLATAFAKEDLLLFVPLFLTADWCILRLKDKNLAPFRSLALAYAAIAVVGAMLFCWNRWIVPSPFTSNLGGGFERDWSLSHVCQHAWRYATDSTTPRVVSIALATAVVLGLLRRGHRVAALSSLLLPLSLVLPYTILVKFQTYYHLNWLSIAVALSLVGIAVALRPLAPGRLSILPWIVPVSIMATAVFVDHSAAILRRTYATYITQNQENGSYIIQQVLRRQAEFAQADTVAVQGIDDVLSPWCLSSGRYMNGKLRREIHWLVVAGPASHVVTRMKGKTKLGQVEIISEQDLAAHPGVPILKFDARQNMTIHASTKP